MSEPDVYEPDWGSAPVADAQRVLAANDADLQTAKQWLWDTATSTIRDMAAANAEGKRVLLQQAARPLELNAKDLARVKRDMLIAAQGSLNDLAAANQAARAAVAVDARGEIPVRPVPAQPGPLPQPGQIGVQPGPIPFPVGQPQPPLPPLVNCLTHPELCNQPGPGPFPPVTPIPPLPGTTISISASLGPGPPGPSGGGETFCDPSLGPCPPPPPPGPPPVPQCPPPVVICPTPGGGNGLGGDGGSCQLVRPCAPASAAARDGAAWAAGVDKPAYRDFYERWLGGLLAPYFMERTIPDLVIEINNLNAQLDTGGG